MNLTPPVEDLKILYGYPASFIYPLPGSTSGNSVNISDYAWQGIVYDAKGNSVGLLSIDSVDDYSITVTIPESVVNDPDTDCGKFILEVDTTGGSDYLPVLCGKITVIQL